MKVKDHLGVPDNLRAAPPSPSGIKRDYDPEGKQTAIKNWIRNHKGEVMNAEIIGKAIGVHPGTVTLHLRKLKKFGKISRQHIGHNRYTMALYERIPSNDNPELGNGPVTVDRPALDVKKLKELAWEFLAGQDDDMTVAAYAPGVKQFVAYVRENRS